MQKTPIRWGIIGCGDVTEKKSGPAFSKVDGSELVAVMRRDLAKAQDYARRHQVRLCFDDADTLIRHPEVDAVYIATPPNAHSSIALEVAAAKKPCYVEKPMARNTAECDAMIDAFEAVGCPLFVAYYRRALPHFERIAGIIRDHSLGALRQLHYVFANGALRDVQKLENWRYDPAISGGGLLWDLGSHALDLFDFWAGPFTQVSARRMNPRGAGATEELAALHAVAGGGALIHASWNFISPQAVDSVTLSFDGGIIQASVFGPPILKITDASGASREEHFELPENIQFPLIQNVVDTLRSGKCPLSTGQSARRTNAVLDAFVS